jgi:hypothetical protein
MASPLITGTTWFNRALAPVEQALGVTLLGASAYNEVSGRGLSATGR